MKAKFISTLALFLFIGSGISFSQTNENNPSKEHVIRIKMVKNINGVETIIDTTITGANIHEFHQMEGMGDIHINIDKLDSLGDHQVIVKTIDLSKDGDFMDTAMIHRIMNGSSKDMEEIMLKLDLEMNDAEFQKLLEEHGIDLSKEGGQMEKKVIIIQDDKPMQGDVKGDKKESSTNARNHQVEIKVVVRTCNIEDLNKEDRKKLKTEERSFNEKLKVDQVNFYPNPNNGRFNLGFTLEKQGDTEISIMDMNGKQVYTERLANFTGSYRKEIDISNNASGVYYIKVTQGKDSFFKKMILE